MFCKHCYAELTDPDVSVCPRCNRPFDRANPGTYLPRGFPSWRRVSIHTLINLVLGMGIAWGVALLMSFAQQGHINSGH